MQWSQYATVWMMIDDFDGALEMDADGPLMEIALEVVTLVLHAWLIVA